MQSSGCRTCRILNHFRSAFTPRVGGQLEIGTRSGLLARRNRGEAAWQASISVTETDNLLFTALTLNPQPLHLDAEFAASTQHGQILVNSIFTLGLVVGLSVGDTTLGTTLGNLGFDKTTFPNPVFIGDTISVRSRVVDRRESRSKPDRGIVTFEHEGINQRVQVGKFKLMLTATSVTRRSAHASAAP